MFYNRYTCIVRWMVQWLALAVTWAALIGGVLAHSQLTPALVPPCPTQCICLSQSQVRILN